MKIGVEVNSVKLRFSIKAFLINLNRDLEKIVTRIDNKHYDQIYYDHSHDMSIECLSDLQKAILYLEDRRFLSHSGFDFRSPFRQLKRIVSGKRFGAVSTIDQQLVRIISRRYERTLRRKVREVVLAFLLNAHRSKSQIFYAYLHDSYYGYRLEGCEITSNFLFSKKSIDLNVSEACFIAALLARPLPKAVFDVIENEKKFRDITPERIIKVAELLRIDWSLHIKRRYNYALEMFPSIPSSLRIR